MSDTIACFPLRDASQAELGSALARCYREYSLWHGQATVVETFTQGAIAAGVKSVLAERAKAAFDFAQSEGVVKGTITDDFLRTVADHHASTAEQGGRIAAIAMLHNACDLFYWRLVRFGLVINRSKAVSRVEDRKVTVKMLQQKQADELIDDSLENWWQELERDGLLKKWERLIALVGYPKRMTSGVWHFDQETLSTFDGVRHNAIHHDGQSLKTFDFSEFANQLSRAQLTWFVHVGRLLSLSIPPEKLILE